MVALLLAVSLADCLAPVPGVTCPGRVPIGLIATPASMVTGCGGARLVPHGELQGQFVYLTFPPGTGDNCRSNDGSSTLSCLIQNGWCCGSPGELEVLTGVRAGPVRDAWSARFARDVDVTGGLCYDVYLSRGGNGARVAVMPIVSAPVSGRVQVLGYAREFLRSRPGDDSLDLEFLGFVSFGRMQDPGVH
jgi:hypothetical protein